MSKLGALYNIKKNVTKSTTGFWVRRVWPSNKNNEEICYNSRQVFGLYYRAVSWRG